MFRNNIFIIHFQNVKYEKSKKEWLKYESTYQSILKTIQSHLEEILKGTFTTEECNVSLNILIA